MDTFSAKRRMPALASLPAWPRVQALVRTAGWGILLVPVLVLIGTQFTRTIPWPVMAILAVVMIVLAPALAADLAALGLIGFGLYAVYFALRTPGPDNTIHPTSVHAQPGGYYKVLNQQPSFLGSTYGHGVLLDLVAGVLLLALGCWLVPRTIGRHARLATRNAALASRVSRLTETRGAAVDTASAELRRVERDLHDGAQARLVALGINLRAAEHMIRTNPDAALALVAESRRNSARALGELRALVRGIVPPVLADRGLPDAIQALALDSPLATEVDMRLPGRPPMPVESAVYYAVAEALANAAKHAGASQVHIRAAHQAGMLRIEVTDDGHGGADPARGSGLRGIERRLGTFDGILAVSSPPGGPTIIVIEVPCALSSPKTSSC
ncbi:MAG TPA: histidine kinase [Streptosporangiaceae bacterium]